MTVTSTGGAATPGAAPAGVDAPSHGASVDIRSKNGQPPVYPAEAAQAGVAGVVVLRADVDAGSKLRAVSVLESSGSDALDRAALEAAHRWTYAAAMRDGVPVPGFVRIPVRFAP